uniref:Uncharacterized protein n=1 Tax=Nonomuraea gerenzanensis TaxID=93944 RepID=A0A1M4E9L1_9ACTN|nr:hypothetical protein BN4615_P5117 [Nonomuraea gerenzanensis]
MFVDASFALEMFSPVHDGSEVLILWHARIVMIDFGSSDENDLVADPISRLGENHRFIDCSRRAFR